MRTKIKCGFMSSIKTAKIDASLRKWKLTEDAKKRMGI